MKIKSKNKVITAICGSIFACFMSVKESFAYESIYFDASVDLYDYRLVISIKQEDADSEIRGEDEYVSEGSKSRVQNNKWKKALNPESESGPYVADKSNAFKTWGRRTFGSDSIYPTSKLVTIPAMKLVRKDNGKVHGLTTSHARGRTLENIVKGRDRESGNLSMEEGINTILAKIEHLKGGFNGEDDFRNVLMGLAYLFENNKINQVVFEGTKKGQEAGEEKEDLNSEENNNKESEQGEEVEADEVEGNGGNIIVSKSGEGDVIKTIKIEQEGNTFSWKGSMAIMAHTGYKMDGEMSQSAGGTVITFTDTEDTGGKPITYVNKNAHQVAYLTQDDIKYLKLSDLIRHALIKESINVTSSGENGEMIWFEKIIFGILDVFISGFEDGLGLLSLEKLVYNSDIRNGENSSRANYQLGMYPGDWVELIRIMFGFTGIVSVTILSASIIRVFARMTFDSMNVGKRYELKEDISNILKTVAAMGIFVICFEAAARLNYMFVGTVYEALGDSMITFADAKSVGASFVANIVLRIVMVGIKAYVNVLYVVRSINIALLVALAPGFITALSFGKKQIFVTYVRELLGTIFLQSFHAIVLLFIFEAQSLVVVDMSLTSMFTSVVISFAILPLTKTFKALVMPSALMQVGQELGGKFQNAANKTGSNIVKAGQVATGVAAGYAGGKILSNADKVREEVGASLGTFNGTAKDISQKGVINTEEFKPMEEMANIISDVNERVGAQTDSNSDLGLLAVRMSSDEREKMSQISEKANVVDESKLKALKAARSVEKMIGMKEIMASKNPIKAAEAARNMKNRMTVLNSEYSGLQEINQSKDKVNKIVNSFDNLNEDGTVYSGSEGKTVVHKSVMDRMHFKAKTGTLGGSSPSGKEGLIISSNKSAFDSKLLPSKKELEKQPNTVKAMAEVQKMANSHMSEMKQLKSDVQTGKKTVDDYKERQNQIVNHINENIKEYGVEVGGTTLLNIENVGKKKGETFIQNINGSKFDITTDGHLRY